MNKNKMLVLIGLLFSVNSMGAIYEVACGKNAVEALRSGKKKAAEYYITFKDRYQTDEPKTWIALSNGSFIGGMFYDKSSERWAKRGRISFSEKIGLKITGIGTKGYEELVAEIEGCENPQSSKGYLTYTKYVGGFAGSQNLPPVPCLCRKKEVKWN